MKRQDALFVADWAEDHGMPEVAAYLRKGPLQAILAEIGKPQDLCIHGFKDNEVLALDGVLSQVEALNHGDFVDFTITIQVPAEIVAPVP